MNEPVQAVLARRRARSVRRQQVLAVTAAATLHALAVTAAFAVPRLGRGEREYPEYVAVHLLPAAALGVERPAPPAPRPAPPPAPAPEPEPEPEPKPPDPEIPVLPREQPAPAKPPEPRPAPPPAPPAPAPAPAPPSPAPGQAGPPGSPRGSATGAANLTAQVVGPGGSSFPYDYYLDQMLARIRQSWTRPPVQGIETLITFRVLRNGEIAEAEIRESSGSRAFDLAALRAVRNASPLAPLPASYREDLLTVNLIVR